MSILYKLRSVVALTLQICLEIWRSCLITLIVARIVQLFSRMSKNSCFQNQSRGFVFVPLKKFLGSADGNGLLCYFSSEKFLFSAIIFQQIFDLDRTVLQSVDIDLLGVISLMEKVFKKILNLREDFSKIELKKTKFVEESPYEFTPLSDRVRRKKKFSDQKAAHEPILDPIEWLKVKKVYTTIDIISTQLQERFNNNQNRAIEDLCLFSSKRIKEISKSKTIPKDAFEGFLSIYGSFFDDDIASIRNEYINFCSVGI